VAGVAVGAADDDGVLDGDAERASARHWEVEWLPLP
jgi:hypothetical protein